MGNPEKASFFSGGGFSDYFPALSFQKFEVENYVGRLRRGGDVYKGRYKCVLLWNA